MRRALSSRWLTRAFQTAEALPPAGLPLFLCPAVGLARQLRFAPVRTSRHIHQRRLVHADTSPLAAEKQVAEASAERQRQLPFTCSGCGAFTQTTDSNQLGYYDLAAKRVRTWLDPPKVDLQEKDVQENEVINNVLKSIDSDQLTALGFDASTLVAEEQVGVPSSGTRFLCQLQEI